MRLQLSFVLLMPQSSEWKDGELSKIPIDAQCTLEDVMLEASSGLSGRKVYFTDGTLPNYREKGIPEDHLGLSCLVDDAANSMLPAMLRSNRSDSMFHFMKVRTLLLLMHTTY